MGSNSPKTERSHALRTRNGDVVGGGYHVPKGDFGRFSQALSSVQRKLQEASTKIDEAQKGTRRIERRLADVQHLPAGEPVARRAFVAGACAEDDELRREVESLLGEVRGGDAPLTWYAEGARVETEPTSGRAIWRPSAPVRRWPMRRSGGHPSGRLSGGDGFRSRPGSRE